MLDMCSRPDRMKTCGMEAEWEGLLSLEQYNLHCCPWIAGGLAVLTCRFFPGTLFSQSSLESNEVSSMRPSFLEWSHSLVTQSQRPCYVNSSQQKHLSNCKIFWGVVFFFFSQTECCIRSPAARRSWSCMRQRLVWSWGKRIKVLSGLHWGPTTPQSPLRVLLSILISQLSFCIFPRDRSLMREASWNADRLWKSELASQCSTVVSRKSNEFWDQHSTEMMCLVCKPSPEEGSGHSWEKEYGGFHLLKISLPSIHKSLLWGYWKYMCAELDCTVAWE